MQQLHQTAVQLSQASAQTGQVLTWLGETILPCYKNWQAPSNGIMGTVESWLGSNPQDSAAQQIMQRLNDRLSQANAGLPASVSISLGSGGGRRENERYRQAWMAEDVDTWEGQATPARH